MTARGPVEGDEPTLCHIATDGETYGHHHRYGDMALAWALSQVEQGWNGMRLTNYAEFRAKVPATWEVQLVENSSWSCAHGVDALARRLRLQQRRQAGLESEVAPPAARRARLAARASLGRARGRRRRAVQGSVGRARRVHRRAARRRARRAKQFLATARVRTRSTPDGARARAVADGDGAPRDAHVHELRLVLRRPVGHRDRAVHAVRARAWPS